MYPTYEIFNIKIPVYGTLIFVGLLLGVLTSYLLAKKYQPDFAEDVIYSFIYGTIGVGVGGKLLYILVGLPIIIKAFSFGVGFKLIGNWIIQGGYVFYGSLIGAFIMLFLYARQFLIPLEKILLFLAPAIPLIHSFGRIGCLCAGCCYGIECQEFGYQLNNSLIAPPGIKLFPTQLLEAIYCFIIFIVLLIFFHKLKNGYKLTALYVFLYSPFRFFIEFFRGDVQRGFIGVLSTSQFISLVLLILTGLFLLSDRLKSKLKNSSSS